MQKLDRQRITAFEMTTYRRMLRIPWAAKRTNESILEVSLYVDCCLLKCVMERKLRYFGVPTCHATLCRMFGENVCAIVHSGSSSKRKTFQDMAAENTAGGKSSISCSHVLEGLPLERLVSCYEKRNTDMTGENWSIQRLSVRPSELMTDYRQIEGERESSASGVLSRDVWTSKWHVSFTHLWLARRLRTWLTTYIVQWQDP